MKRTYAAGVTMIAALLTGCGSDGGAGDREVIEAQWAREPADRRALICDTIDQTSLEATAMAWEDSWSASRMNEMRDSVEAFLADEC